ncbi:MAG: D-2-hydroxyacid dehydrogenase [Ruminococcus flavefaciens]|nr:D-2-hydroxyacid dehydrogenase [Ruminococcus flavefaciens]MCM1228967.1 D-2-hydroxyacid dehydrogenase [Ruminococcus flavefaciens]
MKITILDWATMAQIGDISADSLKKYGELTVYDFTSPEQTAEHIGDSEIVLCNKVLITRDIIDKCPNLRYIGLFATGFNNIDTEYAKSKNITVCNAGQYSTNAVAQQVFAYILDFASRIREYDSAVKSGEWETSPCFSYFPIPTAEIAGKTLSVVGYGSIGRRVAEIGNAFGMKIIVSTRTAPKNCPYEVTDIETAVKNADFLTFHCPLTEQTNGIVNADLLGLMKQSAVLINTSRGAVVNENDLANALDSGKIAFAYLDVLEKEPMSPDTPLKNARNCVITPHTAWAPYETRERLFDIVCDNIEKWQNGMPQNKVN